MKILNAIVYYNNYDEVRQYIEAVHRISRKTVDIVVVINSDTDHRVEALGKYLEQLHIDEVSIVDYHKNVGYLNALLKPVQSMDLEDYQYYILSNTDIHYPSQDFFSTLAQNRYTVETGCIAPDVYNPGSNLHSNPHYTQRVPKGKIEHLIRLFRFPLVGRMYLFASKFKNRKIKNSKMESCYVYSPHGCYMILTREFMKRIRNYEYGATLYSEESAIGELLIRNHMRCYYDASISVIHDASTVTGKINYRKRFTAWRQSLEYILNEFYK